MRKRLLLILCLGFMGCATATKTSMEVIEYQSVDEMNKQANCEAITNVYDSYGVFFHPPWERKRKAHIRLKDAAYVKGANAVVMGSNNWGVITDQVQGVAYKCAYGDLLNSQQLIKDKKIDGNDNNSVEVKLKTLNKLLSDGLVTQKEFDERKQKLLDDYTGGKN